MIHWLMRNDGTFEFSYPQMAANSYYSLLDDTRQDVTDQESDDVFQVVAEDDIDPYDQMFSITGNELVPYSDELSDSQSDYNVVRF